jgi:hypothetical protein
VSGLRRGLHGIHHAAASLTTPVPAAVLGPQGKYVSPTTNQTYLLNTKLMNFSEAELYCNDNGGHLVSYLSQAEQYEIESAFQNLGVFFPLYHTQYWLGLFSTADTWPRFTWFDFNAPPPDEPGAYAHWGTVKQGMIKEPNNLTTSELCAVANYSQSYSFVYGWSDANCSLLLPAMCKVPTPGMYAYVSNVTNATYLLNTTMVNMPTAQKTCNVNGGHLVAYTGVEEQVDVEAYFLSIGMLLPTYHKHYWIGLTTNTTLWPKYNWTDRSLPPPVGTAYQHWGRAGPLVLEPNNGTGEAQQR